MKSIFSFSQTWKWGVCVAWVLCLWGCPSGSREVKTNQPPLRVKPVAPPVAIPSPFQERYRLPARMAFSPARGPRYAPLQVVELFNPTHQGSRDIHALRSAVWAKFSGAIRWTILWNPQLGKDRGYFYARALLAAERLGIFWSFLRRMMQKPTHSHSFAELQTIAEACGVDAQQFELLTMLTPLQRVIDRDMRLAWALQKAGRPGIFINGAFLPGPYTEESLSNALKYAQAEAKKHLSTGTALSALYQKLIQNARTLPGPTNLPNAIGLRKYIHIPYGFLERVPSRGPGDAPVHIVEFSDFTCLPCRVAFFWLEELLKRFPKRLRFSFKYYPIGIHAQSYRTAELAAAAQDRRKFWPLYKLMFQQQPKVFQGDIISLAKQVGLDPSWIAGELDRRSYRRRVAINHYHGRALGIRAVPSLLINGLLLVGAPSFNHLQKVVQEELWKSGAPDQQYP